LGQKNAIAAIFKMLFPYSFYALPLSCILWRRQLAGPARRNGRMQRLHEVCAGFHYEDSFNFETSNFILITSSGLIFSGVMRLNTHELSRSRCFRLSLLSCPRISALFIQKTAFLSNC